MGYEEGGSLADRLSRKNLLPELAITQIIRRKRASPLDVTRTRAAAQVGRASIAGLSKSGSW